MFQDRQDAGRQLADALLPLKGENPCILALPRGGVPIAFEIAARLQAPLDLILVRKIGYPGQPELAIGAVVDGGDPGVILNEDIVTRVHLPDGYLEAQKAQLLTEIERRRQAYLGNRPRLDVTGRTAIIVDDGIATGATIRAAILAIRRAHPARLVLAVPIAPAEVIAGLRRDVDEVVCLQEITDLRAIGYHYRNFDQTDDATVRDLLDRTPLPD